MIMDSKRVAYCRDVEITVPDFSNRVSFHSGLLENFYLLFLGSEKIKLFRQEINIFSNWLILLYAEYIDIMLLLFRL